jgi:hypothetical protein
MLQNNSNIVKCTILFEGGATPLVEDRLVVASSAPLFGSTMEAFKTLTQSVEDKKTLAVFTANKPWILALRKDSSHAFLATA